MQLARIGKLLDRIAARLKARQDANSPTEYVPVTSSEVIQITAAQYELMQQGLLPDMQAKAEAGATFALGTTRFVRDPATGYLVVLGGGGEEPPELPTPVAPTLESIANKLVGTNNWDDVLWSNTIAPWNEPAAGTTLAPWLDIDKPLGDPVIDYKHANGLMPICLHLHPAGATHKVVGGSVNTQLKQPCLTEFGHIFISGTFPHPAITLGASLDSLGQMIQYIRSIAPALGGDPNKIYVVPRSRGNFINVTAMRPDLLNAAAPTFAGRQSSLVQYIFSANAQGWYSSYKAALANIDDMADAELFYATGNVGQPIPAMLDVNPAEMVLTAPQVPYLIVNYDKQFPTAQYGTRKVDYAIVGASLHWSGSGEQFLTNFAARGEPQKCIAWDDSQAGGDAEQLGYYPFAADQVFRGMPPADAMFAAVARKKGFSAYGIRSDFAGVYQTTDGTNFGTPVTAAGQRLGGMWDMTQGMQAAALTAAPGKPAGQAAGAQRPTVVATAAGFGFLCATATTERMLAPHAGANGVADRPVCYWSDTSELTVAGLNAVSAVGIGAANALNIPIVGFMAGPQNATIDAQTKKIARYMAKFRTNRNLGVWTY